MASEILDDGQPPATPAEAAQQLPELRQETRIHVRGIIKGYGLLITSAAAFLVFGFVGWLIRDLAPLSVDLAITMMVQNATLSPAAGAGRIPIYDELMELVSAPGFAPYNFIWTGLVVGGLALLKRFAEAVVAVVASAGSGLVVELVKALVARPRPTLDFARIEQAASGYSFPSGHVAWYVCFFGFLFYLAWSLLRPGGRRTLALLGTGALVALVGASRIYEGHHWASDALAGYAVGFGWLCLCIWAYRRWEAWHLARLERLQEQARDVIINESSGGSGAPGPAIPS
jgi:undecaprenyl-diphosphatase